MSITETRDGVTRLQQEREECQTFLRRSRTRESSRTFRYTGPPRKHIHDGRRLEPGIVELTRSHSEAWHDRFEPVSDGMPVTV